MFMCVCVCVCVFTHIIYIYIYIYICMMKHVLKMLFFCWYVLNYFLSNLKFKQPSNGSIIYCPLIVYLYLPSGCKLFKLSFTWYTTFKNTTDMDIIQMNLCHPWMKWTNYDLQGKIARIEFKNNFNINIDWYKTSKSYLATNKSKSIVIVFVQCTLSLYSSNAHHFEKKEKNQRWKKIDNSHC